MSANNEPMLTMRDLEREMNHRAERLMQAEERIKELEAERDQIEKERDILKAIADFESNQGRRLMGENARLRQIIADAPHEEPCEFRYYAIANPVCTCWKAALARSPEETK
jgi:chromosome segregation ATPase